jgi:predicted metal-dependent HD superfamily phosphohydrolase
MAVLIDPPSWPAHGTVFSHLVSTSSLGELHAFAEAAGITRRAFDEDHYDVPARRYSELVALGAQEVSGTELVRALIGSGLRVPARRRGPKLRAALISRWAALLPQQPALGDELLDRWGEERRKYHTRTHLLAVLEALDDLLEPADEPLRRAVLLAAWFHDAVYEGVAGSDEQASAALAVERLGGSMSASFVHEVERLVLLTVTHDPVPGDRAGELLCDADLAVLAGSAADYERYTDAVREEYAHVPDHEFAAGRAAVLERLLALDPLYRTARAAERWTAPARRNLQEELASLR